MRPEEVFKRYDIRGKYPEELDEEFAKRLGKALGTFSIINHNEEVIVCRDNKKSSEALKEALIEGLTYTGINVIDIGVGPTDFAAWSGKRLNAISVEVTSSHMPLSFNGFKFMYPEGNGFVNKDLYTVQDLFREEDFCTGAGSVEKRPEMLEAYKKEIVKFAQNLGHDWEKTVVVETLGGTGRILPELLEELGVTVIDISEEDHPYIDPPDPKPNNLRALEKAVENKDAELGIAHDLDADRITVYHDGRFLTGDELFCILAQLVEGPLVASIDTSKSLDNLAEVKHTRVGDPFVMDKAIELNAELAGEPNGHYSFTNFVPYNSGLLTGLIVSGINLKSKLENVPDYTVRKETVDVEDKHQIIDFLKERFSENIISELDGVNFSYNDSDVLVRPSGSSAKVRIVSESKNPKSAEQALNSIIRLIEQL